MNELCMITGASAGIGMELARGLARKKIDLVLVARSAEKLDAVRTELERDHGIRVHVYTADLNDPVNAEAVYRKIRSDGHMITMLVNNAGSGIYTPFAESDLEAELRMIQLNISSLVTLTKLVLPDMLASGRGRIMNIASLVSFFSYPNWAVYAATKAFVLSFTEALRAEVSDRGISVTALCPGPIASGFMTPEMARSNAYRMNPPMSPEQVAERGVRALLNNEGTVVVGVMNKLLIESTRITPRAIMLRIMKYMGGGKKQEAR
ncbi:MAG: SDR family oxidoreductase [Flavobacteriales bacterium]